MQVRGPHGEVCSLHTGRVLCHYGRYGGTGCSYYNDEVNSFIYTRIVYMNKTKKLQYNLALVFYRFVFICPF